MRLPDIHGLISLDNSGNLEDAVAQFTTICDRLRRIVPEEKEMPPIRSAKLLVEPSTMMENVRLGKWTAVGKHSEVRDTELDIVYTSFMLLEDITQGRCPHEKSTTAP